MDTYDIVRYAHIAGGTLALACFWTAATLRKGSEGHRLVGRAFLIAMIAISASGLVLAVAALSRQQIIRGTFLLYIVLITVTPCWLAWRAVRDKRDVKKYTGPVYQALAWVNIGAAAIVLALGIRHQVFIVAAVAAVGLAIGPAMLRFARRPPAARQWWLARHYGAMLGAGLATHVAFLNLGLSRLLPPAWGTTAQRLSWFVPLVVALVARLWLDRRYGARAAPMKPSPA